MVIVERIHHCDKNEYLDKHGPHFNEHTLKFAVSHMYYLDNEGKEVHITPSGEEDLVSLINSNNIKIDNYHLYDCLYVLNMAKADFLSSSIEDEKHIILYVKDLIDDPDGYEGLVFNRWCADLKGKGVKVNWHDFI